MTDNQELVLAWLEKVHKFKISPPCTTIGICKGDIMVGVAVFNNFDAKNIELSCVGKGAFNRQVCKMLAQVAFGDNDCDRITVRVREDNNQVIGLAEKFGWKREGTLRNYYETGISCVIFGMLRNECRFWDVKT